MNSFYCFIYHASKIFLSTSQTSSASTYITMRACFAFFLGGICLSIRFTSLTAYIPMGVILARERKTAKAAIAFLLGICALPGLLGFVLTLFLDKAMFGFWAIPVLGNFHFNVIQGEKKPSVLFFQFSASFICMVELKYNTDNYRQWQSLWNTSVSLVLNSRGPCISWDSSSRFDL